MQKINRSEVFCGVRFNTAYESGCMALSQPDLFGNFDGVDSEGVEVEYNLVMVTEVTGCVDL